MAVPAALGVDIFGKRGQERSVGSGMASTGAYVVNRGLLADIQLPLRLTPLVGNDGGLGERCAVSRAVRSPDHPGLRWL